MIKYKISFLFLLIHSIVFSQFTDNTSPTYPEIAQLYQKLADDHKEIELYKMGQSDYGLPILLCVINGAYDSLKTFEKAKLGTTLLVNNAIHAGEPDGINASLIWINDWIKKGKITKDLPVIGIIPAYNIGGMMNRGTSSRANQNGPKEYGFRGNAQNLDLNRDFIKMDSKNMFTFAKIYQALDPDVFIDTHVSNGANYQYVMSYIASVKERMAPSMAKIQHEELIPLLEKKFLKKGFPLTPYVNLVADVPEKGFSVFNDLPRYAMGYATLMNSISFTTETHMLKAFKDRVKATQIFIEETINWMSINSKRIESARTLARIWDSKQKQFKFDYQLTEDSIEREFLGFEFEYIKSDVTGLKRLKYYDNKPYKKNIPYFNTYLAKDSVRIPDFFIVGGQCEQVISRLKANGVKFEVLEKGSNREARTVEINSFKSSKIPYEGHFLNSKTTSLEKSATIYTKKGDIMILTNQKNRRFIMTVLSERSPDSYFSWNFFDSYLQQKEYFSSYVFEDKAKEILKNNNALKLQFEEMKKEDQSFRESSWKQLYFIYKNSEFFEPSYFKLPVFKFYLN